MATAIRDPFPVAQVNLSAYRGPWVLAGILTNSLEGPDLSHDLELALASLRYDTRLGSLVAGRIGIPVGLTPPIYSVSSPQASEPDIYSAMSRALVSFVGLPDYGAGATLHLGSLDLSVHAYKPNDDYLARQQPQDPTPEPEEPSPEPHHHGPIHEVLHLVTGLLHPGTCGCEDPQPDPEPVPDDERGGGLTRAGNSIVHVGMYLTGTRYRVAIDSHHLTYKDYTIQTLVAGFEYADRYVVLRVEPSLIKGTTYTRGVNLGATYAGLGYAMPYARWSILRGGIHGDEWAAGVMTHLPHGLSLRGGYESIRLGRSYDAGRAVFAVSWRFGV